MNKFEKTIFCPKCGTKRFTTKKGFSPPNLYSVFKQVFIPASLDKENQSIITEHMEITCQSSDMGRGCGYTFKEECGDL